MVEDWKNRQTIQKEVKTTICAVPRINRCKLTASFLSVCILHVCIHLITFTKSVLYYSFMPFFTLFII